MNEPGRTRHDEALRQMDQAIVDKQQKDEDPSSRVPGFPDGSHGDLPHRGEGETGALVQARILPYYEDEAVTLYHGDCRDVLPTLGAVDHVITDPPYSLVVVTSAKTGPHGGIGGARRDLGYSGITQADRVVLGAHIGRVARRWAIVFCDAESLSLWREALEVGGGMKHARMGAWVSPACTPQFTGDRPGTGWEACEIAHAAKGRWRWNGGGQPAVWIVNRPTNGGKERAEAAHPTPKPAALLDVLVQQFTDPGDTILDPFNGSGTTLLAAKRLGRKAIGIEREEKYCEVAAKRLSQGALDLFGQSA